MILSGSRLVVLYNEVTCGNSDALTFLLHWHAYCHGIDDIVDEGGNAEQVLAAFAEANLLYTLPFYQSNFSKLQTTVMLITNAYADSVAWERSDRVGRRRMADVLRFCGNEMVLAVALICGGFKHMRAMSPILRENSWFTHHDESGEAV